MEEFDDDLYAMIGKMAVDLKIYICPFCQQPIKIKDELDDSIFLFPCGHRIGLWNCAIFDYTQRIFSMALSRYDKLNSLCSFEIRLVDQT